MNMVGTIFTAETITDGDVEDEGRMISMKFRNSNTGYINEQTV